MQMLNNLFVWRGQLLEIDFQGQQPFNVGFNGILMDKVVDPLVFTLSLDDNSYEVPENMMLVILNSFIIEEVNIIYK